MTETQPFGTLYVLQLVKDAQQQHGLRHGDYQRYRGYCSRKVNRIRRALSFTHSHKHKSKFQQKPVTDEVATDLRYLEILVFESERCWSYAMQLKYEIVDDPLSRKKFHMKNKLRRAVRFSTTLESISKGSSLTDTTTKLEVQAYHAFISATLCLELKQWANAAELYRTVKKIYEKLAAVVKIPELVELYNSRCREVQNTLKLCEYNCTEGNAPVEELLTMNLSGNLNVEFDKLISEVQTKAITSNQKEISFGGLSTPVSNSKVKGILDASASLDHQLNQIPADNYDARIALYEGFLAEVREVSQKFLTENRQASSDNTSHVLNSVQITLAYLDYLRVQRATERYQVLIRKQSEDKAEGRTKVKPQDFLRLYSQIIENCQEVLNMPSAGGDKALVDAYTFKAEFYQALKCFYMAEAYASFGQYAKAGVLYERAAERQIRSFEGFTKAGKNEFITETAEELQSVADRIASNKVAALANRISEAAGGEEEKVISANVPLIKVLDQWAATDVEALKSANPNVLIVESPPALQPMPCKPLFFDLAFNHIKMPDLRARIEQLNDQDQKTGVSAKPAKTQKKGKQQAAAETEGQQSGISYIKNFIWGGR